MKIYRFYFILLIFPFSELSAQLTESKRVQIESLLAQNVFADEQSLQEWQNTAGGITPYHPALFTALAALSSTLPNRDESKWIPVEMPPHKEFSHTPYNITAMFKKSESGSAHTYIILPGAFTPWKRASYVNQIADILNRNFQDPNIIAFPGFLHPDFLKNSYKIIPWNIPAMAEDIYFRIRKLLTDEGARPEGTGIIGVSLGGSFALMMMAYDAKYARANNKEIIFNLGGISVSPPLHARLNYEQLDKQHEMSRINPSHGLTTLDLRNIYNIARYKLFQQQKAENLLPYFKSKENEFIDRVFNEFTVVNLKNLLSAVGQSGVREKSYYNVFINKGFRESTKQTAEGEDILTRFDRVFDQKHFLRSVERPFLLSVAQDDHVIFPRNKNDTQPEVITDILNTARENPNIIVHNPKYGAHVSVGLLDPNFEKTVSSFFKCESAF